MTCAVGFEVDTLLARARQETGLDDFALERAALDERFAGYRQRFDVPRAGGEGR